MLKRHVHELALMTCAFGLAATLLTLAGAAMTGIAVTPTMIFTVGTFAVIGAIAGIIAALSRERLPSVGPYLCRERGDPRCTHPYECYFTVPRG